MKQILAGSNSQGWRFIVYGSILVYLLFFHSNGDGFWASSATNANPNSLGAAVEITDAKSGITRSAPQRQTVRTRSPIEIYRGVELTGAVVSDKMMSSDLNNFENESLIEDEVNNLLGNRTAIYEENRTSTVSEIAELHSVKNSEDFPFAIANEAQLILRELAIEHRIPQECAEEMSDECLIILERAQAGLMPLECQKPQSDAECEKAFSRFWE